MISLTVFALYKYGSSVGVDASLGINYVNYSHLTVWLSNNKSAFKRESLNRQGQDKYVSK